MSSTIWTTLVLAMGLSFAACTSSPAPRPLDPDRELPSGQVLAEEAGERARELEQSGATGVIIETSRPDDHVPQISEPPPVEPPPVEPSPTEAPDLEAPPVKEPSNEESPDGEQAPPQTAPSLEEKDGGQIQEP